MGLPEINIEFKGKAVSVISRSAMGIVVLILKDEVQTADTVIYKSVGDVVSAEWSAENLDYIQKTFDGSPSKVIVERLDASATDYTAALTRLRNKRFNYLAIPGIEDAATSIISTWIKTNRNEKKTFKAVLPNAKADHEGIINFTTTGIMVAGKEYSTAEYTARIAGILAGLPFTQSATYQVLPEVDSIAEIEDPDAAVDAGELILINDGEKIKIGRGVNSLVTLPEPYDLVVSKTGDYKKIKIVEIMDMITDDIRDVFNTRYVGKVPNTYDNQVLFFTYINSYFKEIAGDEILDPNAVNKSEINVQAQREAWESIGTDTTSLDDQKIKEMSFKSNVFLAGNVKIVDAMEDLDFQITI
ncbi:phage tail sheath C-terminal domain-containing protein [Peribacillus loiseleuriae]|uniref:phage tail sheath C-terminal domain-containing protein n=1 Tax=Peribacillus loiseleuriae TaxID=1679170 RepID=UPI003D01194F